MASAFTEQRCARAYQLRDRMTEKDRVNTDYLYYSWVTGELESFDYLYPAYIRGLAYLESGDGRSAAGEFQKLIDNPGLSWRFITGPLAGLQLGRAQRLMGDNAPARKSYEEFLNIWKMPTPIFPPIVKPKPSMPS